MPIVDYNQDVGRDMSGHGWYKQLTYTYIKENENGTYGAIEVDYTTESNVNCNACKTKDFLWFIPQRGEVYLGCTGCNTSDGPITMECGEIIRKYTIRPEEAVKIMEARNQIIPRRLRKLAGRTSFKIKKSDRPKVKF